MQGSRTSHPFKVIEPETVSSSQIYAADGSAFQNRGASSATTNDRLSITESIGSERTTSSFENTFRGPNMATGGFGLVGSESGSSIGGHSDIASAPAMLRIETFVSQVSLQYSLS